MLNRFTRGDWIGAYQVESRLRSGGMATLFLARRSGAAGFSRQAAIKVIHPHLSQDERFVRMFVDEARISSKISHPNVVHVEEFGEENGLFFLVMEYVDGCSASQLLRMLKNAGESMPIEMAAHIAFKVAEGLHSAHETKGDDGDLLGIVHRDVSPSNVLLSREGGVKIIDFGIAKARGRIAGTEAGSSLKGKIRYMSPEQARGLEVDRRSDVYAVGVVLWELLASDRAFEAANEFALLEKVRDPQLQSIRERRPEVPEALDNVLRKATSKDPDDRPATAYDLSRLIAQAVPEALLVDRNDFSQLIERVPKTSRIRDGATPASVTERSWVSEISTSKPSASDRFPLGSSPSKPGASVRAKTSTDVFDPELFVEPTPLPAPVPLPGYGSSYGNSDAIIDDFRGIEDNSYDSVVIATPEAAATHRASGSAPWLTTNRTILIGASLVALGVMVGIMVGLRGDSTSATVAPAITAPAASTSSEATPGTTPAPAATPVATPAATPAATATTPAPALTTVPAATSGDPVLATDAPVVEKARPVARRFRRRRVETTRREPAVSPTVSPRKQEPTLRTIDGVTIAGDSDDETSTPRKSKKKTDEPSRVGKTPLAEGFDD